MWSNNVCSIGLDDHIVHFDRVQMYRVCSGWSTLIERAGDRSVRVCLKWPTLTELAGHRSIRACSRCPVLFQGGTFARGNKTTTQRTLTEEAGHRSDRACSRWPCVFQETRLGLCRLPLHLDAPLAVSRRKKSLATNLVGRPAIWGESGVSMMIPTPDPPYKISRNFKL